MKHAIVTGATGFVGRWLIRELLESGVAVTAVVRPDSANLRLLPTLGDLRTVECPMDGYDALPALLSPQPDCVFYHLAWAGVSGSDRASLAVQQANVTAAVVSVSAAKALGCRAWAGLGSIMEQEAAAVTAADGSVPGMGYLYGEAKHFAHLATKAQAAALGIPHLWPMLTNAYGEYEYSPRFLNSTLRKILHHEPLEFTAGTQNYDFIHVEDAARALCAVGERGQSGCAYLIGSGTPASLRSFVERLGRTLAPEQPLHFGSVPYTGAQLPLSALSIQKLTADTGFVPQISFEDGLRRTMDWIMKTEET